jgi:hypothetical protein
MRGFLKRLRGVIKTGLMWAVVSVAYFSPFEVLGGRAESLWIGIPFFAGFGFIMGGAFAAILSLAERHRRLEDLSLWRVALWGALGGLVFLGGATLVFRAPEPMGWLVLPLLTAGLGSGSVALAKRADRKLIEGEDEPLPSLEEDLEPERIG